jgi:outer membrane usher protein
MAHPAGAQQAALPDATAAVVAAGLVADEGMAFLEVRINGQLQEAPRPLLRRGSQLLASAADLRAWNLVIPGTPTSRFEGRDYYDLRALAGARLALDENTQTADLQLAPEAFEATVGAARGIERPPVFPSVFGAFVNYDLVLQQDSDGTRLSGLVDATASGDWGNVGTSFLTGQARLGGERTTRLESTYSRDDPDRLHRLSVGDAISQASPWSTPVRFGGVQFGTRFGLQPGYVTYPLPTLRGGASVPSSVEVYVDNVLRYQQAVPVGPFAINNVPVLSGAGEMRFAVTDALGVRRFLTTPYYVSANLLRAGLSDYSVEAGWVRRGYGERSFDYGDLFASGSWRRGLSDAVTLDVRAEAAARSRTAGAGLTWVWGSIGEFALHAAGSSAQAAPAGAETVSGTGHLWRAAYTRTSSEWSFTAMRQAASRNFTQIGWQDGFSHLSAQTQLFAGRSFGRLGTVGASYTQLAYSTGDRVVVTSANWALPIGESASLATFIARSQQNTGPSSTTVGLTFSVTLGRNRNTSVSTQRTGRGRANVQADYSQQPLEDLGWGYRVRAAQGDSTRAEAGVDWRTHAAVFSADVSQLDNRTAGRLRATGSAGTAGGMLFASRLSTDAFALVTVENSPGVMIYRENQPWTETNASGRAIVPGLRAYGSNLLSIDPADLPIEATLRRDSMLVVPRYKTVADVRFDLSYDLVVNATVRLPDGELLPPGLDIVGSGRADPLISGFGGAVSIAGPRSGEVFEVQGRNWRCRFTLGEIDLRHRLPSLGPYTCDAVSLAVPPLRSNTLAPVPSPVLSTTPLPSAAPTP